MRARSSEGWIPGRFHVSVFCGGVPDRVVAERPNTRLISLPQRRRTVRILREFLLGRHDILFYVKSSPASRLYLGWRKRWKDRRITIGTVESQSDIAQRADDCAGGGTSLGADRAALRLSFQQLAVRETESATGVQPAQRDRAHGRGHQFFYSGMGPPRQLSPASFVCGIVAAIQTATTVAGRRRPLFRRQILCW